MKKDVPHCYAHPFFESSHKLRDMPKSLLSSPFLVWFIAIYDTSLRSKKLSGYNNSLGSYHVL